MDLAGKWHNAVIEILSELCGEWEKAGTYKKTCRGDSEPIAVSYMKTTYYYQPDLYAVYVKRGQKIDIYEVIDTETEGEAVMDIVYSALARTNVLAMICSDESKLNAIRDHAKILLNRLYDEDRKKLERIYNPKYFIYLPRAMPKKRMKKKLRKQLDF